MLSAACNKVQKLCCSRKPALRQCLLLKVRLVAGGSQVKGGKWGGAGDVVSCLQQAAEGVPAKSMTSVKCDMWLQEALKSNPACEVVQGVLSAACNKLQTLCWAGPAKPEAMPKG